MGRKKTSRVRIRKTPLDSGRGRKKAYREPLNIRVTTEFTKTMSQGMDKKIAGKQSRAEYIRDLACADLGVKLEEVNPK